jgi:hypothetical protein
MASVNTSRIPKKRCYWFGSHANFERTLNIKGREIFFLKSGSHKNFEGALNIKYQGKS